MNNASGIQDKQVARIMSAINEVIERGGSDSLDPGLVRNIVELEVEFQFVEDRQRVQKRIQAFVDQSEVADGPRDGGAS